MGCVNSRTDINDLHPNIFQVMNVDDFGNLLTSGRLEVTESDLVLYQRGKRPLKWPLRCLRRYGYDSEIFSFESGRRCSTGAGIYAFKCQRADQLFNLVQTNIQDCNNSGEDAISRDLSLPLNHHGAPAITRMAILPEPNYLDPTPVRIINRSLGRFPHNQQNGIGRLGSVGSSSGPISPQGTMGSPSPPPLSPMTLPPPVQAPPPPAPSPQQPVSSTSPSPATPPSLSSALYVNESTLSGMTNDLEHNNNKSLRRTIQRSQTVSSTASGNGLISESVAMTSQEYSHQHHDYNNHDPRQYRGAAVSSYMNIDINNEASPLSPSHNTSLTTSKDIEAYSENETPDAAAANHPYMNINPGHENINESYKITRSRTSTDALDPRHCYANLEPGEIENLRIKMSAINRIDKSSPLTSPPAEMVKEVNYAVLDLDKNHISAGPLTPENHPSTTIILQSSPPESPSKLQKGYATIDFNKTAALSHSVYPNGFNDNEGSRKTRHNSTINDFTTPSRQSSSISE